MDLAFAGGGRNSDFYEAQFDVKLSQDNTCPAFLVIISWHVLTRIKFAVATILSFRSLFGNMF
jgi:hypothetical protein